MWLLSSVIFNSTNWKPPFLSKKSLTQYWVSPQPTWHYYVKNFQSWLTKVTKIINENSFFVFFSGQKSQIGHRLTSNSDTSSSYSSVIQKQKKIKMALLSSCLCCSLLTASIFFGITSMVSFIYILLSFIILVMAIGVVEFSRDRYKIRKVFA